ncbi:hypothetical protein MNV49_002227 [Pseudohyphozyma bogoriensis]|nr:hypothetical protein MNV49_002227 [Pseudohyphozyma bogoriensis]
MNTGPAPTATFVYKTVGNVEIKADVFLPPTPSASPLPILLWYHGGGCLMSSRVGIAPHLRRSAAKYNFCVVSADYRLAPQVSLVDIVEDVVDAATWCRTKLSGLVGEYKLDTERLIVSGGSAGGYLALLAASPKHPVDGIVGNRIITHEEMAPHVDLDAPVLSGYGPVPYPPPAGDRGEVYLYMVQEAILEKLLFAKAPEGTIVEDYIPATYITQNYPPTYVFHGAVDNRVGIEQSHSLVEAMEKAGATYEYKEVPLPEAQHLFDQLDPTVEMEGMYDFITRHF